MAFFLLFNLPADDHAGRVAFERLCFGSHDAAAAVLLAGEEKAMLYYALIFLVLGLVAGLLGVYSVAAVASQIAYVLFVIAAVLLVVHLISGRTRPVL